MEATKNLEDVDSPHFAVFIATNLGGIGTRNYARVMGKKGDLEGKALKGGIGRTRLLTAGFLSSGGYVALTKGLKGSAIEIEGNFNVNFFSRKGVSQTAITSTAMAELSKKGQICRNFPESKADFREGSTKGLHCTGAQDEGATFLVIGVALLGSIENLLPPLEDKMPYLLGN